MKADFVSALGAFGKDDNPDALVNTRRVVAAIEAEMAGSE
jgi:hypothetical protein